MIAANPKQVEQYKGGKTSVIGFLVGQVMKATRGQANPAVVNQLLKDKLCVSRPHEGLTPPVPEVPARASQTHDSK